MSVAYVNALPFAQNTPCEDELRFQVLARTAPLLIWCCGPDKMCTYFNQRWLQFTGRTLEESVGNGWIKDVHPRDKSRVIRDYSHAFDERREFRLEYRLKHHSEGYRWILNFGAPVSRPDGNFLGYLGSCVDPAARDIEQMGQDRMVRERLILALDDERKGVARELHDDIGQRLALLNLRLQKIAASRYHSLTKLVAEAKQAASEVDQISSDVHNISRNLHPSMLSHTGLVPAVRKLCSDHAKRERVHIIFRDTNVRRNIPDNVSFALFRITQECLADIAKHGTSRAIRVHLKGAPGGIKVEIIGNGHGVDSNKVRTMQGLGLTSTEERVRQANGVFTIHSNLSRGTRISVWMPIPKARFLAAAGGAV